jgi:hypothetical protein
MTSCLRAFLLAALLLVLLPLPAHAEPISIILSAIAAAVSIAGIVKAVVGAVIAAGLSLAANAIFASKPRRPSFGGISNLSREIIENKQGTVEYIPVVYGQHKVGGVRVFEEVSQSRLFLVTVFCEGPISSIDKIYIDGVDATDDRFDGLVEAYTFLGSDDQSVTEWTHAIGSGPADFLAANPPGWTADHRLRGCAGVALRLRKNTNKFPRIPVITGLVSGKKVYDPRDLTTKYTTNPALCARDYYTSTRYGARIPSSRIDDTSFIDAANYFDQTVNYGNGNQKRFEMNGILDTSQRVWDNIEDMMRCCNSLPKRVNGKHGILPLKTETVAFTFTDDNVTGGIHVERLGKRFKKNKVNGQFINPDNNWQADLYVASDATYKTQDNNLDLTTELELPMVTNWYQAAHLTNVALRQSRLEEKYTFNATHESLKLEIGDVAQMTHSLYGFSGKQMRITSLTINPDGAIGVGAEEYDADVYNTTSANEPNPGSSTTFGSPFEIDPPGTPSISQSFTTNSAGFVVNVVTLSWTEPVSAQVARYIVEYKLSSSSDWIKAGEPESTTFSISDIVAGVYDFAVSAVNTIGRISDRSTRTSIGITNNTDAPEDVTGFTHEFTSGEQITLRWDRNSDVTVGGGYRIRLSNKTSGAAWTDFPQLNILVPERATTVTLGLLEGTYMIKAENLAGVQSENVASIPIVLPDHDEWVNVTSVTESTTFGGSHSNTESSTGTLTLSATSSGGYYTSGTYLGTSLVLWDDFTGLIDSYTTTTIDEMVGSGIDLGGTYSFKLTRDSSGTLSNTASNWDSFTDNIDTYTSVNVDDMAGRSTVDVKHYFATSTQNSTGPFGEFQQLQTVESVGRYLKFKTTIDTESNTENVNIQELAFHVWMKRRAESGSNISVSSSGGTISFAAPFYATPNIQVFPFNGSAGQYVTATTSQTSRTGFSVAYFTSSGGQTSGKISWAAFGYGKEIL